MAFAALACTVKPRAARAELAAPSSIVPAPDPTGHACNAFPVTVTPDARNVHTATTRSASTIQAHGR